MLAAVAAAIDHVLGERKRRISGQRTGAVVTRERKRVVRLGDAEIVLDIDARGRRAGGALRRRRQDATSCTSDWKPGEPLWAGTVDGEPVAVQVRPVPNGFDLMLPRRRCHGAYVYTEREAEVARLMPAQGRGG